MKGFVRSCQRRKHSRKVARERQFLFSYQCMHLMVLWDSALQRLAVEASAISWTGYWILRVQELCIFKCVNVFECTQEFMGQPLLGMLLSIMGPLASSQTIVASLKWWNFQSCTHSKNYSFLLSRKLLGRRPCLPQVVFSRFHVIFAICDIQDQYPTKFVDWVIWKWQRSLSPWSAFELFLSTHKHALQTKEFFQELELLACPVPCEAGVRMQIVPAFELTWGGSSQCKRTWQSLKTVHEMALETYTK